MVHKKKYHGGLKVFLLLLFTMLLGSFSTSYASVTTKYVGYCVDNLSENFLWDTTYQKAVRTGLSNMTSETKGDLAYRINQGLIDYNINELNNFNMVCLAGYSSSSSLYLYFIFSNMSTPNGVDNLGYLFLNKSGSSWVFGPTSDLNNSYNNDSIYYFRATINLNNSQITSFTKNNIRGSQTIPWSNWSYNSDNEVLNLFVSSASVYSNINPIYAYYPINNGIKRNMNLLGANGANYLKTYPEDAPSLPDEPSDSGESTVGQITNNSGEVTGSVNLKPIEGSLNRIEDKIPTSGEIQGVLSGEIGKITDTITSQPDLSLQTITSGDIERRLRF